MLSSRTLNQLPTIEVLNRLCQSLAMLDAIVCPAWEYRYYSYNAHWDSGEAMASMRNGSGDSYFLLFTPTGAILKGFGADAIMSPYRHTPPQVWPGILDKVPVEFAAFLTEPAFVLEETTFCIWRRRTDTAWQRGQIVDGDGPDPDGSEALLTILDGEPATYQAFAEAYYERVMPLEAIAAVYAHRPLTIPLIQALNPTITPEDVQVDRAEIGYP